MDRIHVELAQDHVEALAKVRKPIIAVEELIWNAVDADARQVQVQLGLNNMGGLDLITISDDGHGIERSHCHQAFGTLGGSDKPGKKRSPEGRFFHGKYGKGRFRAFGLGRKVVWKSRYQSNSSRTRSFEITGSKVSICDFAVGPEVELGGGTTGVTVEISEIDQNFPSLTDRVSASRELAQRLALYLSQYPGIHITYDGTIIDPNALIEHQASYPATITTSGGTDTPVELTVIEWSVPVERRLYFCDEHDFAHDELQPGIQAPGFHFTAYLKSPIVHRLVEEEAFALGDLHADVKELTTHAKDALRKHFREREAQRTADVVSQWKVDGIYPYEGSDASPIKAAERQVFDVCALKVHEYLPSFESTETANKQLTFRLIKEALESNPRSLQSILREVLSLPEEQQNDLANLLQRTRLSAIINAARVVVDRLDFLQSLDDLLFGGFKKTLLERRQLHRILAEELWVFGEEYLLGVDDQALNKLLAKHIAILERTDLVDDRPVTDLEGRDAILDLMLYKRYPRHTGQYEHLVIELKRPSCTLGEKEISQIRRYAFAVAQDERFDKYKTHWKFVLIGNAVDNYAEQECAQEGKEFGHIYASKDGHVNVYVHQWNRVIDQAKWRYEFFRQQLEYEVTADAGLEYLHAKHKSHIPVEGGGGKVQSSSPHLDEHQKPGGEQPECS